MFKRMSAREAIGRTHVSAMLATSRQKKNASLAISWYSRLLGDSKKSARKYIVFFLQFKSHLSSYNLEIFFFYDTYRVQSSASLAHIRLDIAIN